MMLECNLKFFSRVVLLVKAHKCKCRCTSTHEMRIWTSLQAIKAHKCRCTSTHEMRIWTIHLALQS